MHGINNNWVTVPVLGDESANAVSCKAETTERQCADGRKNTDANSQGATDKH
jgi:hypothetical protein